MNLESIINNLKSTKAGRILLHILLWLFYFGAFYYFSSISLNGYQGSTAVWESLKNIFSCMLVYYPLVYFVWPRYWLKKKYFVTILFFVLIVIIYALFDHQLERIIITSCESCMEKLKLDQHGYYQLFQRGTINVVLVQLVSLGILYQLFVYLAFPITVKALVEHYDQRFKTLRLQQENIMLEFNFLKAQINPHFLFNTLNNVYALILKDKKEASAETVAKLSNFMRYTLYESNSNNNNLIKEIDLLKVYIDLEKIRLNDTIVNFISNTDDDHYTLPPLLFLPAVENAFKFCTSTGDAYIFLKLEIKQSRLTFIISNTFDKSEPAAETHGGIGLKNFEKRLSHYYPGDLSSMKITKDDNVFQMIIHINLT